MDDESKRRARERGAEEARQFWGEIQPLSLSRIVSDIATHIADREVPAIAEAVADVTRAGWSGETRYSPYLSGDARESGAAREPYDPATDFSVEEEAAMRAIWDAIYGPREGTVWENRLEQDYEAEPTTEAEREAAKGREGPELS